MRIRLYERSRLEISMSRQIQYILFSDIKGYSHLTDKQIVRLNNEVLPLLNKRIEHHETSYKNTWGDGIVFASSSIRPICSIGVEIRDFFINFDWEDAELPQLQVRSSIHQGESSALRDPFTGRDTVIGPSVIRAARLEPVTKPNQVWVTQAVAVQIQSYENTIFSCDPLGDVALPKNFGSEGVYALRRTNEEPIEPIVQMDQSKYRVGIGIVLDKRNHHILLVKRAPGEELSWMFPSVKVLPFEDEKYAIFSGVAEETGVSVIVHEKIGSRVHPLNGKDCLYYFCTTVEASAPATNLDSDENLTVAWVPIQVALDLIGGGIFDRVKTAIQDMQNLS